MNSVPTLNLPEIWPMRALRRPVLPIVLAAICLALDILAGPSITLSSVSMLPVVIAAWFCRPGYAYALAILQPVAHLCVLDDWESGGNIGGSVINALIQLVVLTVLTYWVARIRRAYLLAAQVQSTWGVPPVCSVCSKVRDEQQQWQPMEIYIARHPEVLHPYNLCPDCLKRDYDRIKR